MLICTSLTVNAQEVVRVQNGATLTIQPGVELLAQGSVTLANGSTIINNGTIRMRNGASGVSNWTDNTVTPYNHGAGRVIFNSTGSQSVTSPNIFGRIETDNTALTLGSDIQAAKWYLITGVVSTGAFRVIALSSQQLAVEADASNINFSNSWINGNLRWFISPSTVNNYRFPTGNASRVNLAELDNLTAIPLNNLTYIDASFTPKPGSDAGLLVSEDGTSYVSVHPGGVWRLNPDADPTSGRYDLKLYFNGFAGLQDNRFAILRRPDASSNAADWQIPAGSSLNPNGGAGRMVADGYARRNQVAMLGQFGIGELSFALPVTLTGFDAIRLDKLKVKLQWRTSTEQNNRGFEIERRLEHEPAFATLGFVATKAANGNSVSPLEYTSIDPNGFGGISYYRLKQTDRDGRSFHTLIKAVKGMGQTSVSILLWPNPARGQFSLRLDGAVGTKDAIITDLSGKAVRNLRLNNHQQINVHGLPAGTYIITVMHAFAPGEHFKEKIVIVR
jgi:hypothetical protein